MMWRTRCFWLGHAWRFVARRRVRTLVGEADPPDGLAWVTWLCRHCPARIDRPNIAGRPDADGVFTRGDLLVIGLCLAALALVLLNTWPYR